MSNKDEIRQFLTSRRANLTPADARLPDLGDERRVPGLRREEVAQLAGVSTDYYTRLERGNLQSASDSVLNALARALQLTDVERDHLFSLARPAPLMAPTTPRTDSKMRSSMQRVLDNLNAPAVVYNARQDLVAANDLGRALYTQHFEADHPNMAQFIFLDSRARTFYDDWELACSLTAAMLRFEAGRDPLNAEMTTLIGELSTRSPQFRTHWADHDVHEHRTGSKTFRHPHVGALELDFDVLEVPGQPDLHITAYTPATDAAADGLVLLRQWAVEHHKEQPA